MKISSLLILGIALMTTGCASLRDEDVGSRENRYVEYFVMLKVVDDKLVVTSPPQGDEARGKANGWVGFAQGTHGRVVFAFEDYQTRMKCTDDKADSAEWVLTTIALSKTGRAATQKGSGFGTSQTGWVRRAFPGINKSGYLVKDVNPRNARPAEVLLNNNSNSGRQVVYYEIEARRCDGTGEPLKVDPGIGNGGRK